MESFDLFNIKSVNGEFLNVIDLKMDHLNLINYQIEFLFKEVPVLNFLLLLFNLYTVFSRLLTIFCFLDLLMLYSILYYFLKTFN